MTGRAYVRAAFLDMVEISLGRINEQIRMVYRFGPVSTELIGEGETSPPGLMIEEDLARALLDALARHFGGTSEALTTRSDLLAERKRVDKMIDHLIGRA